MALNRTFVLPQTPSIIDFQMLGDELLDLVRFRPFVEITRLTLVLAVSRLPRFALRTRTAVSTSERSGDWSIGTTDEEGTRTADDADCRFD